MLLLVFLLFFLTNLRALGHYGDPSSSLDVSQVPLDRHSTNVFFEIAAVSSVSITRGHSGQHHQEMRLLIFLVTLCCVYVAVSLQWNAKSLRRSVRLGVAELSIKPVTVASVPDIKDDEKSRSEGNMRPRAKDLGWASVRAQLKAEFGISDDGTYLAGLHRASTGS
jgi:hypothetical protein